MNPALVLADEPTGNLDSAAAEVVFALMRDANVRRGTTFLIVTHNLELAKRCDRIVYVVDGRLVADHASAAPAVPPPTGAAFSAATPAKSH